MPRGSSIVLSAAHRSFTPNELSQQDDRLKIVTEMVVCRVRVVSQLRNMFARRTRIRKRRPDKTLSVMQVKKIPAAS
jgi:hypothetical protein